jgi:PAS domain S-box-containing protein
VSLVQPPPFGRRAGAAVLLSLAATTITVWDARFGSPPWTTPTRAASAVGLVVLLVIAAVWLVRSDLDGWAALSLPAGALAGLLVFVGVVHTLAFDPPGPTADDLAALVLVDVGAVGGAVGLLVGLLVATQSATIRRVGHAREEYRDLFDGVDDAVLVHDSRGRIVAVNESATTHFREDAAALTARTIGDVEGDRCDDRHATAADRIGYETTHATADGRSLPVEVRARLVSYRGSPAILSVARERSDGRPSERELARARDQLRALNRVLRHDIRNDMQIVLGLADLLADHVDEDGRDYLDTITETGDHVVELTRSARHLARTVAGDAELPLEPVGLPETLREELDRRRAAFADATFVVDGDVPDVDVRANDLLSSVFRNLLNNAVQHSDRDAPTVTVSADLLRGDHRVRVRIADDGPGIPDRLAGDVFTKGEKGLESAGTGLGLYLVESLVEEYGGRVWTEDNDPRGTVVVVELPIAETD